MSASFVACVVCGHARPAPAGAPAVRTCERCGASIRPAGTASLERTAALSLAALALYAPANLFPILRLNMYGATSETTVWQGCVKLYQAGDMTIALIVFLASIVIPLLKLLGLFTLSATTWRRSPRARRARTRLYRFIDAIGRWAMLDVFVLAVLVSLVRLQKLASILPGEGALAFAGVVVFTTLAAQSFDPRLIWEDAP